MMESTGDEWSLDTLHVMHDFVIALLFPLSFCIHTNAHTRTRTRTHHITHCVRIHTSMYVSLLYLFHSISSKFERTHPRTFNHFAFFRVPFVKYAIRRVNTGAAATRKKRYRRFYGLYTAYLSNGVYGERESERDSFAKKNANNHLLWVPTKEGIKKKKTAAAHRVKTDFYYYIYFMEEQWKISTLEQYRLKWDEARISLTPSPFHPIEVRIWSIVVVGCRRCWSMFYSLKWMCIFSSSSFIIT